MTEERLSALKQLAQEATEGPWRQGYKWDEVNNPEHWHFITSAKEVTICGSDYSDDDDGVLSTSADSLFICESRTALPEATGDLLMADENPTAVPHALIHLSRALNGGVK